MTTRKNAQPRAIDWNEVPPDGYRRNARGDLVHEANINPVDVETDRTVEKIHRFGAALSAQMWRYRDHTLIDIYALLDRIVETYGGKAGGRRGNVTLTSFDGRRKVTLAQAERIAVGPEIRAAQAMIEECIEDWSARGNKKLRALVDQALVPDATGQVPVSHILRLRRVHIDDPRWRNVQLALSDALRPAGKAEYIRLHKRDDPTQGWRQVPLSLASVIRPAELRETSPEEQLHDRVQSAVEEARHAGLAQTEIRNIIGHAAAKYRRRSAEESE